MYHTKTTMYSEKAPGGDPRKEYVKTTRQTHFLASNETVQQGFAFEFKLVSKEWKLYVKHSHTHIL